MNGFFPYLLKVSAGIALVSLPYYLLMRKDPNLGLKRFFLLAGLILSFIFPLLYLRPSGPFLIRDAVFFLQLQPPVQPILNTGPAQSPGILDRIDLTTILLIAYLAGILILTIRNFSAFLRWKKMRRQNTVPGKNLVVTEKNEIFTLFRTIHLPLSVMDSEEYQSILIHEKAHVRQLHFIDLLFCETAIFLTWFNPFTWLITRMIKENHEHLADREVLSSGIDPVRYRAHLLNQTLGVPLFRFGLAFSHSLTKKRFDMMKNLKSGRTGLVKAFLLTPLILFSLSCMSNSTARDGKITGIVRFADSGEPAPGASVIIKGSTVGTVTDEKGRFELAIPGPVELMVSYVGYKTCSNTFKPGEKITFDLVPDVVDLEVPFSEKSDHILEVRMKDGGEPLVLVDGVENNDYASIDPETIEKIEVIKEASVLAEKFPGKDTKDGVIMITLKKPEAAQDESGEVFVIVEDMPHFPGGNEALSTYIYSKLEYPEAAKARSLEGYAYVLFTVDKEGKVGDVKISNSSDPVFNAPAMAVFVNMPAWKPGYQHGKPVPVKFSVRVDFRLPRK
ncbi:MAG: TonB family protein [Bacteroidota bacterium]